MNRIPTLLLGLLGLAMAAEHPIGHPDHLPSAERPSGWRGDGTGAWLGATPPRSFDAEAGTNLVWRTAMPAPSYCVPIVVGEKVFTMADPNILVCCNVHTGAILWQQAVDHTEVMTSADRQRCRELSAAYEELMVRYGTWRERLKPVLARLTELGVDLEEKRVFFGKKDNLQKPVGHAAFEAARAKDPQMAAEFDALFEEASASRFCVGNGGNSVQVQYDGVPELKAMHEELVERFSVHTFSSWQGFVCDTYPVPCTDGTSIYVMTSQHAFGCYDLDGTRRWLVWYHPDRSKYENTDGRLMTRFTKSPILYGDYLVARGDSLLRVLDKATGALRWEHCTSDKEKDGRLRLSCRPTPEAGNPTVGSLTLSDGGRLAVVIDPLGTVHRLADGKQLAKLPQSQNGVFRLEDDIYFGITGADDRGKPIGGELPLPGGFAYRLTARSTEQVDVERLWVAQKSREADGNVFIGDEVYGNKVWNRVTGKLVDDRPLKLPVHYGWPIIAGDLLIGFGDGGKKYGPRTLEGVALDRRTGEQVGEYVLRDDRALIDADWRIRWCYRGSMGFITTHSPSAQANRLFLRTQGYLWCFGDPQQAFPVPKDCPPAARVGRN